MTATVWGRRGAGILFWVLVAVVVLAQLAVIAPEFFSTRLWEDEAFNLTVPLNLLAGHGYASNGLLSTGQLAPFDVRISTGPVVLLPVAGVLATGIDPVVGGRLVSAVFYLGLLVALWLLGRRLAGRWGALFAVLVPVALNTNQLPSPVQGPIDVLGEIPAAALIAWSFVLARHRPWLGGLILGLAIQTKFIGLLAAPTLLVYVWFVVAGQPWRERLRRCVWFTVWAAAPTAVYWLAVLVSLGWAGFVHNAHQFLAFLKSGGQTASVTPGQKADTLLNSWFVPASAVVAVIVAALVIGSLAVVAVRSAVRRGDRADAVIHRAGSCSTARDVAFLLIAAGINLVLWVGWWAVSRGTPAWIRYPATGLAVSIPMFAAGVVLGVRVLWHQAREARPGSVRWMPWAAAVVAAVLCAGIVASTGVSAQRHATAAQQSNYGETLAQQHDVARQLADLGEPGFASPWGSQIGAMLLSRVPFTNENGPDASRFASVLWTPLRAATGQATFEASLRRSCATDPIRIAEQYAVCRLR